MLLCKTYEYILLVRDGTKTKSRTVSSQEHICYFTLTTKPCVSVPNPMFEHRIIHLDATVVMVTSMISEVTCLKLDCMHELSMMMEKA